GKRAQNHGRPVWPHSERRDASFRRAVQLAGLKQGPPDEESVPPLGQTEGVGAVTTPNQPYANQGHRKRGRILGRKQAESIKKDQSLLARPD
ncbi:MAG TPA: hypothetical protein DD706_13875, partial [Nitrospiraceae bacterium]|nr:hypothetical protein [Nitrospiraceae bacterium]